MIKINTLECGFFFSIEGHVALDRNPGSGFNALLLQFNPRGLYSACPHRLPGLLGSLAALSNSYPNTGRVWLFKVH